MKTKRRDEHNFLHREKHFKGKEKMLTHTFRLTLSSESAFSLSGGVSTGDTNKYRQTGKGVRQKKKKKRHMTRNSADKRVWRRWERFTAGSCLSAANRRKTEAKVTDCEMVAVQTDSFSLGTEAAELNLRRQAHVHLFHPFCTCCIFAIGNDELI